MCMYVCVVMHILCVHNYVYVTVSVHIHVGVRTCSTLSVESVFFFLDVTCFSRGVK